MRRAIATDPTNPVYRDRLLVDLFSLAWKVAQSNDHAQTPELLEEMLEQRANWADYFLAAQTMEECMGSISGDEKLEKNLKIEVFNQYSQQGADYLRRG